MTRTWYVNAFEKFGDRSLVRSIPTRGFTVDVLRDVWEAPPGYPIHGVDFPITAENVSRIQPYVPEELDLDNYTWMLSNEPTNGTD